MSLSSTFDSSTEETAISMTEKITSEKSKMFQPSKQYYHMQSQTQDEVLPPHGKEDLLLTLAQKRHSLLTKKYLQVVKFTSALFWLTG